MKIQFIYGTYGSTDECTMNNALNLHIIEQEGKIPKATIEYDIQDYEYLRQFDTCRIIQDGTAFFNGIITALVVNTDTVSVELSAIGDGSPQSSKQLSEDDDVIDRFKIENPDLFVSILSGETLRTGDVRKSNMLIQQSDRIPSLDGKIVADSLKIRRLKDMPIGEMNLEILCSWISKRNGSVTLSSQIGNRFRLGKVNTLTPKKLTDSWPRFGDHLASNARPTRYFVSTSRLAKNDELPLPPVIIADDIPRLTLKRYSFDSRLGVAWDYDQFMTEILTMTVLNQHAPRANKKAMRINLKNVQEYVDNDDCYSFFRSKNGRMILDEIQKSIGAYIALSMRNIEISCDIIDTDNMINLDCTNWVSIGGITCKITGIERQISPFEHHIKIMARGFEDTIASDNLISPARLDDAEVISPRIEDVIRDIVVQNESDTQYEKLLSYIAEQRRLNRITSRNYRRLISNFLNENQTKIQIALKPLKTQHCEKRTIALEPVHMFLQ
ncbi:MAG: hypothetical protein LBD43_01615 [Holosporales bacterium]|jgi:hypothetical protein|nr:hypothetical protein [Holosporales bacterium]